MALWLALAAMFACLMIWLSAAMDKQAAAAGAGIAVYAAVFALTGFPAIREWTPAGILAANDALLKSKDMALGRPGDGHPSSRRRVPDRRRLVVPAQGAVGAGLVHEPRSSVTSNPCSPSATATSPSSSVRTTGTPASASTSSVWAFGCP